MTAGETQDLIAFLTRPESYGLDPSEKINRIETHISEIFLAGDRAYKLKRPVSLSYVDFGTVEKRLAACQQELLLNRRTAPELYLGLTPVLESDDGFELGVLDETGNGSSPDHGQVADWLVTMRAFEGAQLLSKRAERDELTVSEIERLAWKVADFHMHAEIKNPQASVAGKFSSVIDEMGEEIRGSGIDIPAAELDALIAAQKQQLKKGALLLERRAAAGFVRHCHGDMHLNNIVSIDGDPVLFDCIEFNLSFAEIDLGYDLAFLLMDLAFRASSRESLHGLANRALNAWLDHLPSWMASAALQGLGLLPWMISLRAGIRAHVLANAAASAQDGPDGAGDADGKKAEAKEYFAFARNVLSPPAPRLVVVAGLSGTGKSTLAKSLAADLGGVLGAIHLRTDILRKRYLGAEPIDRLGSYAYTKTVSDRVYEEMFQLARIALRAGQPVLVDGVFAQAEERQALERLAREEGVAFEGLWLEVPLEVAMARAESRRRHANDPSDAGPDIVEAQYRYDTGSISWARIDAQGTPERTLAQARQELAPAEPGRGA